TWWIKFLGGGYLLWLAVNHWFKPRAEASKTRPKAQSFLKTVLLIELTDVAFAADSVLAAVAVSDRLWVVITGGVIGLVLMRFAVGFFIDLLQRFERLEQSAYLLVFGVGVKLLVEACRFSWVDFHSTASPAFWVFWGYVTLSLLLGFMKHKRRNPFDKTP